LAFLLVDYQQCVRSSGYSYQACRQPKIKLLMLPADRQVEAKMYHQKGERR